MNDLLHAKCQAKDVAPMNDADIHSHLALISGWQVHEGAIEKAYTFKNYYETIAFVNALAWISHIEDHHPDLAVSYSRCTVRYTTHSAGGISLNDFICAAKADSLVAFVG